ncbi:hypothetical protein PVK06_030423 [Gossypium arboreum]|uniref:Cyclic nucleotide-binding domain-containing protein n=1 Tax=Gossypium arboreum TaxID=29729 RepID=A0ABR0NNA1_GOSAR|nr:hypothetical protein PVK06_030421 [Gossypium arboreum]KAK5802800.1 hypothetical protein PVK06_030423 [Gossypium arboreum]
MSKGKEKEIKNEMSEKERSILTNQRASCLCVFPSIQVSKGLSGETQLRYLPKERLFTLINKDQIMEDLSPHVSKGKQGKYSKAFQSPSTLLNDCDLIEEMVICHSLTNDDAFVLKDDKESNSNENFVVGEYVGEISLNQSK